MPFSDFDLRATSLEALRKLDIVEPTPIQAQAIPIMLEGADIIAQAHTGSGKTLAFGLPLMEAMDPDSRDTQALVLCPTRELAAQVGDVLSKLAKPAGMIVLILDEADQMLDKGFAPDVERIINTTPPDRQTALFSATTPDWVKHVAAKYLYEPETIAIGTETEAEPDIEHSIIEVWDGNKLNVLVNLLAMPTEGATLVFGRTRHGVINLARRLQKLGFEVEALQGDLGQPARDRIVKRFREGHLPILLATNVAARGLDMLNIERVINYDIPETSELFVHRVGRTGRMGRSGQAITIIAATDLSKIREIERDLNRRFPRIAAPAAMPLPDPTATRPAPIVAKAEPVSTDPSATATKPRRRRRPRGGQSKPEGQLATSGA